MATGPRTERRLCEPEKGVKGGGVAQIKQPSQGRDGNHSGPERQCGWGWFPTRAFSGATLIAGTAAINAGL